MVLAQLSQMRILRESDLRGVGPLTAPMESSQSAYRLRNCNSGEGALFLAACKESKFGYRPFAKKPLPGNLEVPLQLTPPPEGSAWDPMGTSTHPAPPPLHSDAGLRIRNHSSFHHHQGIKMHNMDSTDPKSKTRRGLPTEMTKCSAGERRHEMASLDGSP